MKLKTLPFGTPNFVGISEVYASSNLVSCRSDLHAYPSQISRRYGGR